MIFGFKKLSVSKLRDAACLSVWEIPDLSFRFPSSFRTSCGTIHSIFSVMIWSAVSWMSILFLAAVMMKFVSSRICMSVEC